ncbi:MAG: PqiC family protein [Syntrophales bacterium]|jgi:uncharacterized lipoprotein YmbA|nr:PqiC family protein [Syntrophales bacterium]
MMKNPVLTWLCCLLFCLCGCYASQPPRFYTLTATAKPTVLTFRTPISVGPVIVPALVDRPQMVIRLDQNQVRIDEYNRWAVSLQHEIARVVAENLAVKLGSPGVTVFPQSAPDAAAVRVKIDIKCLEAANTDRTVTLDAHWSLRIPGEERVVSGRTFQQKTWTTSDYDGQLTAYNRILERLSEDIAASLLQLEESWS